jgi:SAM-dependent methyltransferase
MKLSKKNDWSKLYGANRLQDIISEYKRIYQTKSNQQQILNKFCEYISNGSVDQNIVELGSAPGGNLVYMNKKCQLNCWGVEYTKEGVDLNTYLFEKFGLNTEQIIHMDFLDVENSKYVEYFDNLISFGVIEHFDNPQEIIKNHLQWVRPGGKLFIVIPNLQYLYLLWNNLFNKEIVAIHNLELIKNDVLFETVGKMDKIEVKDHGYFGTFDYGLFTYKKQFIAKLFIYFLYRTKFIYQPILDRFLRDSKLVSPYQFIIVEKLNAKQTA